MSESKKTSIRMATSSDLSCLNWPMEFVFNVGHDAGNMRAVTMHMVQCTDCKGVGAIQLFTSTAPCDKCLGQGLYFEGANE